MNIEPRQKSRRHRWVGWVFLVATLVTVLTVVLNRAWIYDWYRGVSYQPAAEMMNIRDDLNLTNKGRFLFDASQPELNDAEDFNRNCRQDESEIAVLGCYALGNIYVYNITDNELDGIRELTAAHELLHAVWARMSNDEKAALRPILEQAYEDNLGILKEDIETYDESERIEEVFVRAGTEVKTLPNELEKYYTEIFADRNRIVNFYDGYIVVFREIEERMQVLISEIEVLGAEINAAMAAYEAQASQLEADVVSFNSCAEVVGCFGSDSEFYLQRANLMTRQDELETLNVQINEMITEYNSKVEEYNANVTESRKLQNIINSNSVVEM